MRSMTGHGSAVLREKGLDIEVEIRSLNHRFLNLKMNLPAGLVSLESEVEKMVRARIARGSVNILVSIKRSTGQGPALPGPHAIRDVYRRLKKIQKDLKIPGDVTMESLLSLPHLWVAEAQQGQAEKLWPKVRGLIEKALDDHYRMRTREGKGIRNDFLKRLTIMEALAKKIMGRAPHVMKVYENRLLERVNSLVTQHGVEVSRVDLAREVAIFSDRSDISEELQRLVSHCKQFRKIAGQDGQIGRKMDFMTQEMAREANTMAAKGNDSGISALAVEIKSEIEKIKEQAENVE